MPSEEGESPSDKLLRRSKENPVVPIGVGLALGACAFAAYNFKNRGDTKVSVYLVQLRVIAQGCVVGALAVTAGVNLYHRLKDDKK